MFFKLYLHPEVICNCWMKSQLQIADRIAFATNSYSECPHQTRGLKLIRESKSEVRLLHTSLG
jgi:hypothetical protein